MRNLLYVISELTQAKGIRIFKVQQDLGLKPLEYFRLGWDCGYNMFNGFGILVMLKMNDTRPQVNR